MSKTLHIVNHPEALPSCLAVAGESDVILLIGEAVLLALVEQERPLSVLAEDLPAGSRCASGISRVAYPEFVDLVVEHQPIISWR